MSATELDGSQEELDSIESNGYHTTLLERVKLLPIKRTRDVAEGTDGSDIPKANAEPATEGGTESDLSLEPESVVERKKMKTISSQFSAFKNRLLRHINHSLPPTETRIFTYLRPAHLDISRILKQVVLQRESHSAIIVGPRNSYKSFLINHELELLKQNFADQFITIRLNGLIHSEQAAISGIATQLQSELQRINRDNSHGKAYDSIGEDLASGPVTEIFERILDLLDATRRRRIPHESGATESLQNSTDNDIEKSKVAIIFIFDEIDTLAGPVRQTLLYNVFDMVEYALVPVCILGTSTRLDVSEYLEKRVKSRFSQRIIYMPEFEGLDEFCTTVKEALVPLKPLELEVEGEEESQYLELWEREVDTALKDEDTPLFQNVKANYETYRSLSIFRNGMQPLIFNSTSFESLVQNVKTCEILRESSNNQLQNSTTAKVLSLSDLELAILIALTRKSLKSKDGGVNFNLTYVEYREMIREINSRIPSNSSKKIDNLIKQWSKEDVKNVWETLQTLDFITEKGAMGIRESAIAVFYASNYLFSGTTIPFDLRIYYPQVTLQELRRIVPKSSMFYPWTQL